MMELLDAAFNKLAEAVKLLDSAGQELLADDALELAERVNLRLTIGQRARRSGLRAVPRRCYGRKPRCPALFAFGSRELIDASRTDADAHGKNIIHGLDMSGTMRSSPGALSSSFMSKSESQIAQPL
jgi:hypothetical protein